jgi:DNA-binding CsgD family transcriptional regulator
MRELLQDAARGTGCCVAVVGPAGIGKTSLLAATRALGSGLGLEVLDARGGELEQDFAYGVTRRLLERPLHRLAAPERVAVLGGAAAHAAAVLGAPGPPGDGDAPFAVVHGLYWACANLASRGPLLLLVDDLHWADEASLRFLAYLARRVDELPVALVTTARPPYDAPALAALTLAPDVVALEPSPLSEQAVGQLARAILGTTPDPGFTAACHRATGGNPFLCTTLISDPEAATARSTLAVVVRRLGRLGAGPLRLARAVAILGADVALHRAAALAGLGASEAAAAHAELAERVVLRPETPLEFVHPLVRAAIREDVPAAERALLHAAAARMLHAHGASAETVAGQLMHAEPVGEAWAVEALRRAASVAEGRGDPGVAASFLRRALSERPPERAELLRDLAGAELRGGEPEPAVAHLEDALRSTADDATRIASLRLLASGCMVLGRFDDARERTLEAVGLLDAGDDLVLELEAELLGMTSIEPSAFGRGEDLDRPGFVPSGRTRGERAWLAAGATSAFFALRPAHEVVALGRRALDGGLFEDHRAGSVVWNNLVFPLIFSGAGDLVGDLLDDAVEEATRRGSVVGAVRAHAVRGMLHLRTGALRESVADSRIAARTGLEARMPLAALALGALVEALAAHGELGEAEEELGRFGLRGAVPDTFYGNWALHGRGWLRLAQDRPADARDDFEELGRRRSATPAMSAHRRGLALALVGLGDTAGARAAAAGELELARRVGTSAGIGASMRALGLATGGGAGLELLRDAVGTLEGSGARLEHARALVDLGAAMRRAGRRAASREPLRAGMELAHRCAAGPLAERARDELVATGARPRRMVRTGVDALTPSELRVARMAATGMTNREIAQALFVTARTVETHLTHAYPKLGIVSREDLGAALAGDR